MSNKPSASRFHSSRLGVEALRASVEGCDDDEATVSVLSMALIYVVLRDPAGATSVIDEMRRGER